MKSTLNYEINKISYLKQISDMNVLFETYLFTQKVSDETAAKLIKNSFVIKSVQSIVIDFNKNNIFNSKIYELSSHLKLFILQYYYNSLFVKDCYEKLVIILY